MSGDDRDLKEYFAAVRREEEARVPAWRAPRSARQGGRLKLAGRLAAAVAGLATTIAAVVWLLPGVHVAREGADRAREQAGVSITSWKPATDFLLETPGRELLQSVPAIGDGSGVAIAPGPVERHRHLK